MTVDDLLEAPGNVLLAAAMMAYLWPFPALALTVAGIVGAIWGLLS